MPRRKFTREFKLSAVQLVNQQGYSIVQAAKSLGIDPSNVRGWVQLLRHGKGDIHLLIRSWLAILPIAARAAVRMNKMLWNGEL